MLLIYVTWNHGETTTARNVFTGDKDIMCNVVFQAAPPWLCTRFLDERAHPPRCIWHDERARKNHAINILEKCQKNVGWNTNLVWNLAAPRRKALHPACTGPHTKPKIANPSCHPSTWQVRNQFLAVLPQTGATTRNDWNHHPICHCEKTGCGWLLWENNNNRYVL